MPTPNLNIDYLSTAQSQKEVTVNQALLALDKAVAGCLTLDMTGVASRVLTADEALNAYIKVAGGVTADREIVLPAKARLYIIDNKLSPGYSVSVKTAGGTAYVVATGKASVLYCDGANVTSVGGGTASTQIGTMQTAIDSLQTQVNTLTGAEAGETSLFVSIQDQITTLNAAVSSLSGKEDVDSAAIGDLKTRVATLESSNASLLTAAASHSTTADVNAARDAVLAGQTPLAKTSDLAAVQSAIIAALPVSSGAGATTDDLTALRNGILTEVDTRATPTDVGAARDAVLAGQAQLLAAISAAGGGAAPGQILTFNVARVDWTKYTQVSGAPISYGADLFTLARAPSAYISITRLTRASDGVHSLGLTADGSSMQHSVLDESTNTWVTRVAPNNGIWSGSPNGGVFVTLNDGRLLFAQPPASSLETTVRAFTISTGLWSTLTPLPVSDRGSNGITLNDGRVLVVNPDTTASFLYDPVANSWVSVASIGDGTGTVYTGLAILPSANVLITAGTKYCTFTPSTKLFTAWKPIPGSFNLGAQGGCLVSTSSGAVCLCNAAATSTAPAPMPMYTESGDTWAASTINTFSTNITSGQAPKLLNGGRLQINQSAPYFVKYNDSYAPVSLVQVEKK